MKFSIKVGELEKHQLNYDLSQLFGRFITKLNQQEVKRNVRLYPELNQDPALDSRGGSGFSFGSSAGGQRASASAFTLVETLIATLIAATMLLALYASFAVGFSMMKVTREDLRANQIILQRMETIRLSAFNQLKDPAKYPASVTEYYSENGKTNGNGGVAYTVTYTAVPGPTTLPPSYRTNVLVVTVGASWTSGNVPRSRSVQTYVANRGIQAYVSGNY